MPDQFTYDIFLSHSTKDMAVVRWIAERLRTGAQSESGTFRFRDPLNKERRFLPLLLGDAPGEGFKRPWRPPMKMDAAVRKRIDQLFNR